MFWASCKLITITYNADGSIIMRGYIGDVERNATLEQYIEEHEAMKYASNDKRVKVYDYRDKPDTYVHHHERS